jgi:hypothetical protein
MAKDLKRAKNAGRKKSQWGKGPIIKRIKLNPEQAVLACCTRVASFYKCFSEGSANCHPWPSCGFYPVTAGSILT